MLLSSHAMAAAAFKVDEVALDKDEANQLAKAIADVAEFYPVEVDPKTLALWNLGIAVVMVEGPRAWFLMKKAQAERAARARPTQATAPKPPAPRSAPQPAPGPGGPGLGFPEYVPG